MSELLDAADDVLSIPVAQARSREDFIACLDRARVLAGPLSHREIESRSGRRLRRTKIGQVLAGEFPAETSCSPSWRCALSQRQTRPNGCGHGHRC